MESVTARTRSDYNSSSGKCSSRSDDKDESGLEEDALWSSSSSSSSSSLPPQGRRVLLMARSRTATDGRECGAPLMRSMGAQLELAELDHDRAHAAMENPKDAFKEAVRCLPRSSGCSSEVRLRGAPTEQSRALVCRWHQQQREPPTTTGRMMPPHSLCFLNERRGAPCGGASLAWREGKSFACAVARRVLQVVFENSDSARGRLAAAIEAAHHGASYAEENGTMRLPGQTGGACGGTHAW